MHFFIDHTKLPNQSSADLKYGPSSTEPENSFILSTQFQLTEEAKAFACQSGMMVVRKNDSDPNNLVNLYIKPDKHVEIEGLAVRYYIYRGVKFSSFFTMNGSVVEIKPENASTNNEFIASYWRNRTKIALKFVDEVVAPSPLKIGYGDNNLPLTDPTNLNENRPIRDLFNGKAPAKAFKVVEGMWIGDFTKDSKISFEIQLDTELRSTTTLGTSALHSVSISLSNLTDDLAIKRRKELVTTYIDPSAFFGMHADVGLKISTYSGATKNTVTKKLSDPDGIFRNIILKFENKHRVYLDIKSEKGMSYNFYNNYKISSTDASNIKLNGSTSSVEYVTSGWPIMFFETLSTDTTQNRKKLSLKLRIDGNNTPILYLANKSNSHKTTSEQKNFLKIKKDGTTGWTNEVVIFPRHLGDTNKNILANHIKLYYFIGEAVDTNTRLKNKTYYDSSFCSIDIENIGEQLLPGKMLKSSIPVYIKEPLQTNGTGNFSFASETGTYWDNSRILFYSKKLFSGGSYEGGSGKKYLPTYSRPLKLETINNSSFNAGLRREFDIVCKKYQTTQGDLKILGVNSYHKYNDKDFKAPLLPKPIRQHKEDLMLFGITLTEFQRLKSVTGLSTHHPRHIFLHPDYTNFLVDSNNMRYYRFIVKVQGLNADGTPTIVEPTTPVIVYSRDKQFFHSLDFAQNEDYNFGRSFTGDNRIEFHIYNDGITRINDNIDLALIRKKRVTGIAANQAGYYTIVNDDSVTNDTSSSQEIYYLYYNQSSNSVVTNTTTHDSLCHLNVIMDYKRVFDGTVYPTVTTTQGFANLEYTEIFDFTSIPGDIWAKRSYKHNNENNGTIITRGIIKRKRVNGVTTETYANKKYKKLNIRVFMVIVNEAQLDNSLANRFNWLDTVRYFARPDLFAVFLAALRNIDFTISCFGFAYPDASSFPSNLHVNGNAFDTNYKRLEGQTTNDQDLEFIRAINRYGIGTFRIGPNLASLRNAVNSNQDSNTGIRWLEGGELHNTHLHTEDITIDK